jgi:hypothetical protein
MKEGAALKVRFTHQTRKKAAPNSHSITPTTASRGGHTLQQQVKEAASLQEQVKEAIPLVTPHNKG